MTIFLTIKPHISLLASSGKILARILNSHLKTLSERILPETQAGFRLSRSTNRYDFLPAPAAGKMSGATQTALHGLYRPLQSFQSRFKRASQGSLCQIWMDKFIRILQLLHDNMFARVQTNGDISDPFEAPNSNTESFHEEARRSAIKTTSNKT